MVLVGQADLKTAIVALTHGFQACDEAFAVNTAASTAQAVGKHFGSQVALKA